MSTILIEKNVLAPMRDGVRLATDVYRLEGSTPAPVLVTRTPYDKERAVAGSSNTFDILRAVQAGYVVLIQDVRGRYASNVFLPGHCIRLEVSSSNFPRFDRNSNTGGEIVSEAAGQYRPAINRIFHDAAHPSRLILPIIER